MKKNYFKLNNIEYVIGNTQMDIIYEEEGIKLFFDIDASTNNTNIDDFLSCIRLYHNDGFQTGLNTIEDLKGKKYSWSISDEETGLLYVVEHEAVGKSTIEIVEILNGQMIIRWEGFANVFWDEEFGKNVPFEAMFSVQIPETKKICINAYKNTGFQINSDCKIELINYEDIEFAVNQMRESKQHTNFNTTLNFKIVYQDNEYYGKVIYTNGTHNYETIMDENSPIKVKHCGFIFKEISKEFYFIFEILK